ncbi:MAG: heme-binding domain-containing protein [Calditrichaceae bacterium]
MKSIKQTALIVIILFFAGIQLIPVSRSNPPVETEVPAPDEVKSVLKRACYDCHSNEVNWPWYSYVAPASWLVAYDVKEARKELNFSTWNRFNSEKSNEKIKEIWEEVSEGKMPLWQYTLIHSDAKLSESDLTLIKSWTGMTTNTGSVSTEMNKENHDEDHDHDDDR